MYLNTNILFLPILNINSSRFFLVRDELDPFYDVEREIGVFPLTGQCA